MTTPTTMRRLATTNELPSDAELRRRFDKLVVRNSRLDWIEGRTLEMLEESEAFVRADLKAEEEELAEAVRRGDKIRPAITYTELRTMLITGPSGSTKTTSMVEIASKLQKKNPGKSPVLILKLQSQTTKLRHLILQILEALNDPQAVLLRRQRNTCLDGWSLNALREAARGAGTYVVVLDEAHSVLQHIRRRDQHEKAQAFAGHIKTLINAGLFGVIVMGTDDAKMFFETSPELNNRKFDHITLNPINLSNPDDFKYFYKLIGRIDREMVEQQILDEPMGLINDVKSRALLYDMSGGVPGVISRILMIALRSIQREGRRTMNWDDIRQAFWIWSSENKDEDGNLIKIYDPFADDIRPTTAEAIKLMSKKMGI